MRCLIALLFSFVLFATPCLAVDKVPYYYGQMQNNSSIRHFNYRGSYYGRTDYSRGTYKHYSYNGSYAGRSSVYGNSVKHYSKTGAYVGTSRK